MIYRSLLSFAIFTDDLSITLLTLHNFYICFYMTWKKIENSI